MAGVAIEKAMPNNANVKNGTPAKGMSRPNITEAINPMIMTMSDALYRMDSQPPRGNAKRETQDMMLTAFAASVMEAPCSTTRAGPKLSITTYAPLMNIQMAPAMQSNRSSSRSRRAIRETETSAAVGASR